MPPRALPSPGRFALVLGLFLALASWRLWPRATGLVALSGRTMGTTWSVKVVGAQEPEALRQAVAEALAEVDGAMSTWKPDSELSQLNRHAGAAPFPLSPPTREVLVLAREVSELSGGAFDVTVAPLVDAWGFGPGGTRGEPDEGVLAQLRADVGYRQLTVLDAGVLKATPRVQVDLSAIAKGYGVDRATRALEALGVSRYLVEVGGELRVRGRNADDAPWQVGLERPDPSARAVDRVLPLEAGAVATSGDYRNFYERGGQRRSHTIDPRTGRPIEHALASVTVVAPTCAQADALATALNVLGPDDGLALARDAGVEALFLVRQPDGGLREAGTGRFEALPGGAGR